MECYSFHNNEWGWKNDKKDNNDKNNKTDNNDKNNKSDNIDKNDNNDKNEENSRREYKYGGKRMRYSAKNIMKTKTVKTEERRKNKRITRIYCKV